MIIDNKLDRSLGPSAGIGGFILFTAGLFFITSVIGIIITLAGAYAFFTFSGTRIDTESGKLIEYELLFGIIRYGKWESLSDYNEIKVIQSVKSYRAYGMSNKELASNIADFRVILRNNEKRIKAEVMKCKTFEIAKEKAGDLGLKLNLPVV